MCLTRSSINLASVALVLVSWVRPMAAQRGGNGGGSPNSGNGRPSTVTRPVSSVDDIDSAYPYGVFAPVRTITGERSRSSPGPPGCFRWPMSGTVSASVSATQLEVPDSAYKEFEHACRAAIAGKFARSEEDLKAAIKDTPHYVAAWVLLGQVQADQNNEEVAARSCQHASEIDSKYLLPYLCLADLAAHADKWEAVVALTIKVLQLHPIKSPGAYYYNSLANFNLHQLDTAEKSGLEALVQGRVKQKMLTRLLLAKIYEAKGDRASEAVQLHGYLKLRPPASEAVEVRRILQEIKSQQAELTPVSPDKK